MNDSSPIEPETAPSLKHDQSPVGPFSLTPEDIREFQEIVAAETGVTLSSEEAWNRAIELTNLFRMLRGPLPEDPERASVQTSSNLPSSQETRQNT